METCNLVLCLLVMIIVLFCLCNKNVEHFSETCTQEIASLTDDQKLEISGELLENLPQEKVNTLIISLMKKLPNAEIAKLSGNNNFNEKVYGGYFNNLSEDQKLEVSGELIENISKDKLKVYINNLLNQGKEKDALDKQEMTKHFGFFEFISNKYF